MMMKLKIYAIVAIFLLFMPVISIAETDQLKVPACLSLKEIVGYRLFLLSVKGVPTEAVLLKRLEGDEKSYPLLIKNEHNTLWLFDTDAKPKPYLTQLETKDIGNLNPAKFESRFGLVFYDDIPPHIRDELAEKKIYPKRIDNMEWHELYESSRQCKREGKEQESMLLSDKGMRVMPCFLPEQIKNDYRLADLRQSAENCLSVKQDESAIFMILLARMYVKFKEVQQPQTEETKWLGEASFISLLRPNGQQMFEYYEILTGKKMDVLRSMCERAKEIGMPAGEKLITEEMKEKREKIWQAQWDYFCKKTEIQLVGKNG